MSSQEQELPVRFFDDDPNIYLFVSGDRGKKWYYYNPDSAPLGEGAMGKVYVGNDYDTDQKVAIKQLFDKYANNKSIRERAYLEASLSYSHPNLVEMLGSCMFEDDEGDWHVWVLSNYVRGKTIDKKVRAITESGGLDLVQTVSGYIMSVLDALDYLHSKGVIHRDIKPSNIMVDDDGTVKLMDLGVARVTTANAYTSMGFVGTPLYASPEQILRDKTMVQATPASDIYSLGMTFYVLLNGSNPFDADTEAQILTNQVTKKLPPCSEISKKYKKLMAVIWKATEKNQEARYQSALEFKMAIQKALVPDKLPWWYWAVGSAVATIIISVILLFLI